VGGRLEKRFLTFVGRAVPPQMKHYLHLFDYAVWLAVASLQWTLLAVSLRKGMARLAPSYIAFLVFATIESTALTVIAQFMPYPVYFWAFYFGVALETALLFFVVYDVFRNVFDPLSSLPPRTVARLVYAVAIIAAVSITLAIWKPAVRPDALAALARTFERTTDFIVSLSFWSVVFYARKLGIPWRSRMAGIAAGFLLYLTSQSVTTAVMGFAPQSWFASLNRIGIVSYLASVFMWLHAVQREEAKVELPTPEALLQLTAAVGQMRSATEKLSIQGKTRWQAE
jgi:hypothetical protein